MSQLQHIIKTILRRKWLLLLVFLPFLIPLRTVAPHYKIQVEIRLNPPKQMQSNTELMNWLNKQINSFYDQDLLIKALQKSKLSYDELKNQLSFISENLDVNLIDNNTLHIALIGFKKDQLRTIAAEIITTYLDTANEKEKQGSQEFLQKQQQLLDNLNNEIEKTKFSLSAAKIKLEVFQQNKSEDNIQSLRSEINNLKQKLLELQKIYTQEHPLIKEIQWKINQKNHESDEKQARIALEQEKEAALKKEYDSLKISMEKLIDQQKSSNLQINADKIQSIGSIISNPRITTLDTMKIKILDLTGKLMAGIMLLITTCYVMKKFDKGIYNEKEIRNILNIRALGTLPKQKKAEASKLLIEYPENSVLVKSYEAIRSNIQFINLVIPIKSILYTSLLKNRDDIFAGNLAISMAHMGGRVTLINAAGDIDKYKAVSADNTRLKNLKVLNLEDVSGLDKEKSAQLLKNASCSSDVIIIDTCNVCASVTAASLATASDGVIMGVEIKKTDTEFIARNYKILSQINAKVLGVILQW